MLTIKYKDQVLTIKTTYKELLNHKCERWDNALENYLHLQKKRKKRKRKYKMKISKIPISGEFWSYSNLFLFLADFENK